MPTYEAGHLNKRDCRGGNRQRIHSPNREGVLASRRGRGDQTLNMLREAKMEVWKKLWTKWPEVTEVSWREGG